MLGCIDYLKKNQNEIFMDQMQTVAEVATEMIACYIISFTDEEKLRQIIQDEISKKIEMKCEKKIKLLKQLKVYEKVL